MCQKCMELFNKTIALIDFEVRQLPTEDVYFLASMLTRATMMTEPMLNTVQNYKFGAHTLCFVSLPGQGKVETPRVHKIGEQIRKKVTALHQKYQEEIDQLHREELERN